MEESNNYNNFDEDYKESIRCSIDDGSYFKDAFNWYADSYLKPIVDRTFFIFMSIMGIFIVYNVVLMIFMLLPLKQDIYISIKEKDLTKYYTSIYDISKNDEGESTDEDILRYLTIYYVKERENHNYKSGDIMDLNNKLTKIGNNSSGDVFNDFKYYMSSKNENGPYYYFGKNIETTVQINSLNFTRIRRKNIFSKAIDYFNVQLLPIGADVVYTLKTQMGDDITYQKRKAVIGFKFSGVEYDKNTGTYLPVKFTVTSYKNYELK